MDFEQMTADEIKNYKGEIYRARVQAVRKGSAPDEHRQMHDFNSTTAMGLYAKVAELAREWIILSCTEGPHSPDAARQQIEDAQPMKSLGL